MNLKSLVNKSIIKSDLRRFWYMGAFFMGWLVLGLVVPVFEREKYVNYSLMPDNFWDIANISVFAMMIFGIIIPTIIFGYLHKRSAVCATHSLPLKRECIFMSHIVSSAILYVIPIVATALIMMSVNTVSDIDIIKWAGLSMIYFIIFGGLALMSSSIAGNIFSAMAISAIVLILPVCTASLFEVLAGEYLFGFSYMDMGSIVHKIDKWYLPYSELVGYKILIYVALGLIFAIIGFICLKKRDLENNSSVTVFKGLNPVFMYGVAFYGGLLGAVYIDAMTERFSVWLAIPFGIAGIIIARMLILKTFRPKNVVKPSLIYILSVVVLYAFFGLDITGYEKRVPEVNEVASVNVSGVHYDDGVIDYYGEKRVYLAPEALDNEEITASEDIKKVIALHKDIVSNPHIKNNESGDMQTQSIPIYYTMKNGKVLAREYNYTITDKRKELRDAINDIDVVKAGRYPVLSDAKKEYAHANASAMNYNVKDLSADEINEIKEAIKKDISSVSVSDMVGESIYCVVFDILRPTVNEDGTPVTEKQYWQTTQEYYYIRNSYKNSIELLKKWGIYDVLPTADDVRRIDICTSVLMADGYEHADVKTVTDKEIIQKYLDWFKNNENNSDTGKGINITVIYNDGTEWNTTVIKEPNI